LNASNTKTKPGIPAPLTLLLIIVTIVLIKKDVLRGIAAVGSIILQIFISIFAFGIPIVSYADSRTPEQIVDAELYDCTKSLMTRPDGDDAKVAGSRA
jgi:hypothetical protein